MAIAKKKTKKKSEETVEPSGPTFRGQPISEMSESELDSAYDEVEGARHETEERHDRMLDDEGSAWGDIEAANEMTGAGLSDDVSVNVYNLELAKDALEELAQEMADRIHELEDADDED